MSVLALMKNLFIFTKPVLMSIHLKPGVNGNAILLDSFISRVVLFLSVCMVTVAEDLG